MVALVVRVGLRVEARGASGVWEALTSAGGEIFFLGGRVENAASGPFRLGAMMGERIGECASTVGDGVFCLTN